jgi:hypothetical protein
MLSIAETPAVGEKMVFMARSKTLPDRTFNRVGSFLYLREDTAAIDQKRRGE